MTPFRRHAELARRQDRVITLEQMLARGATVEQVRHFVRTERLWRVYRRIYALDGPISAKGRARAAVLRMGDRSMSAFLSAAVLGHMWDTWPATPQIILAEGRGVRAPRGVEVHRSTTLRRSDVVFVDGIRTTSPRRTILDCSKTLNAKGIKTLLKNAEYHHRLDLSTLDVPGAPKALQQLLDLYVRGSGLTGNELERRFLELIAALGLPAPDIQRHINVYRVDFVWPEHNLIVETDGRAAHERAIALTDDLRRTRRLENDGWRVMRFTWNEVVYDVATVAEDLAGAISER